MSKDYPTVHFKIPFEEILKQMNNWLEYNMTEKELEEYMKDLEWAHESAFEAYASDEALIIEVPKPNSDYLWKKVQETLDWEKEHYTYWLETLDYDVARRGEWALMEIEPSEVQYLNEKNQQEWKKYHGIETDKQFEEALKREAESSQKRFPK
jgi:hypothetical protein